MGNSLLMTTEATYSLNFLIYIQNIFLNQNQRNGKFKFPYMTTKYMFREEFESTYKKLWDEVSERIFDQSISDMEIFYEEKDLFYQRLFVESDENLKDYTEIYKSFGVWWESFAGRISIERSISDEGWNLYVGLANLLAQKGIEPKKELSISLIYDECILANLDVFPYFSILTTKNLFVAYKEIIPKLEVCIY
ncbi:hypothetical protein [Psychrobacillus sp.]|uniref:hypothetical protein n=1 Tax=Psychrobacillus sp. TaxID=1871623 RepID=UPI0028BD8044|nr:hypothetical protein [Psychrobacillus sp.]